MIPEDTPSVVKQGSHTAICLGRKRKFWWLIPMSNRMLRLIKRTDKQMLNDRWEVTTWEVNRVAEKYLQHGAGVGPVAHDWLTKLMNTKPQQLLLELNDERILTPDEAKQHIDNCKQILKGATK